MREGDNISKASPIGSCGPFHNILPCDGIRAGPPGRATVERWVWDDVEAFCIGEENVDRPHRVEDHVDLCNVVA